MADPSPVAQTFFVDDEITKIYKLDGIITVVDAKHILQHLHDKKEDASARTISFPFTPFTPFNPFTSLRTSISTHARNGATWSLLKVSRTFLPIVLGSKAPYHSNGGYGNYRGVWQRGGMAPFRVPRHLTAHYFFAMKITSLRNDFVLLCAASNGYSRASTGGVLKKRWHDYIRTMYSGSPSRG